MLLSVVMATNKADNQLLQALQSCVQQTLPPDEIILIANGMSDDDFCRLQILAAKIPFNIRIERTAVKFLTFSLNLGIHLAKGKYLARMDADDISLENRFERQVGFLESNPDVVLCGSNCKLIDEDGVIVGEWKFPENNESIRRSLKLRNPICHPSVIVRRVAMENIGGYSGLFCEDYTAWVSLAENKLVKFNNIQEELILYRSNSAEHQRNLTWRKGKAGVAGAAFRQIMIGEGLGYFFIVLICMLKIIVGDKLRSLIKFG